jgi:hypothetical protein
MRTLIVFFLLLSINLNSQCTFTLQTTSYSNTCFGATTGFINLTVLGGNYPPFSYTWSEGSTTQDIVNLAAGNYTVAVTDNIGCMLTTNVVITQSNLIMLDAQVLNPCNSTSVNGQINVNSIVGGVPPYQFLWNNGATTEDLTNLASGTYNVLVTDVNSCTQNFNFIVDSSYSNISTIVEDAICFGYAGNAIVNLSNPNNPITYSWSNGSTSNNLEYDYAGTYIVQVQDALNCIYSDTIQINSPAQSIFIQTDINNVTCQNNNGFIDNSFVGSSSPLSFSWSNGSTAEDLNNINAGLYSLTITEPNGCQSWFNFQVQDESIQNQEICIVGVDSLTNKNRVVWEKPITTLIDSFYIHRETLASGIYEHVGSVAYDSLSTWIDLNSNPAVQSYRYKLSVIDTCGLETSLSDLHKTVHLTINQGVGGAWNLIWSHYEGITYSSYNIRRGTSLNNMTLLTTIQSNLNSYTDLAPPSGTIYYQIEVINPNSCVPTKSNDFSSSKSNVATNGLNNIDKISTESISVYPNPTSSDFSIEITKGLIGEEYTITDFSGRLLKSGTFCSNKEKVELDIFANGVYFIQTKNTNFKERIIKQ